jgi:hypothetical protein
MKEACSLNLDGVDRVVPDAIFVGSRDLGARHQINALRRHSPKRQTFSSADRLIFAGLYQFAPTVLDALAIVKLLDYCLCLPPQDMCKDHGAPVFS